MGGISAAAIPRHYRAAWARVRSKRKYPDLTDELLWLEVYKQYINSLPPVELGATRDELIQQHLGILRPIAGRIAWRRCPKSCGIWSKEAAPHLSHVGLVHELAAFGVFGLLIAADRYKPDSGWAFSTYANFWIKKFIRLYLDEIIGIVPRTGHMGPDPSSFCFNEDGELCWVDFPRRSVMDLVDAALERRKVCRGKASGEMPIFDSGLTISGPNPGDKEIEIVGPDGPTDPTRSTAGPRRTARRSRAVQARVQRRAPITKTETLRRLRYGALLRLLRARCGPQLPDDDAGREYLFELVCVASLASKAADKKLATQAHQRRA